MLIQAAIDFTVEESVSVTQTRMRIMIHPDNVLVKQLYGVIGFVDAGKCTYAEAAVANGDAQLLPADGGASHPEK